MIGLNFGFNKADRREKSQHFLRISVAPCIPMLVVERGRSPAAVRAREGTDNWRMHRGWKAAKIWLSLRVELST